MSKEEQADILGETLIRYQESKKTLCCLETKARRIAEKLESMAQLLRNLPTPDAPFKYNPSQVPKHPSHDESYNLICEIEDLRNNIATDRKSLEGMGIEFPIT